MTRISDNVSESHYSSSLLVSICPSGQRSRVSAVVSTLRYTKEARVRFPDLAYSLSYRPNAYTGLSKFDNSVGLRASRACYSIFSEQRT